MATSALYPLSKYDKVTLKTPVAATADTAWKTMRHLPTNMVLALDESYWEVLLQEIAANLHNFEWQLVGESFHF